MSHPNMTPTLQRFASAVQRELEAYGWTVNATWGDGYFAHLAHVECVHDDQHHGWGLLLPEIAWREAYKALVQPRTGLDWFDLWTECEQGDVPDRKRQPAPAPSDYVDPFACGSVFSPDADDLSDDEQDADESDIDLDAFYHELAARPEVLPDACRILAKKHGLTLVHVYQLVASGRDRFKQALDNIYGPDVDATEHAFQVANKLPLDQLHELKQRLEAALWERALANADTELRAKLTPSDEWLSGLRQRQRLSRRAEGQSSASSNESEANPGECS